ncbi:acyl-CoA dehydrogenase family protein [Streptomyces antioxidans]|uniref:acyl-CoA dehydrogenase family protein n=1 Tax=Streptomyces antioxidans TaxID=1507734 RepID=UPI001F0ACC2F|nr:acyl-CoA dehydrogenase family protein [Streptomyces antioxidans]
MLDQAQMDFGSTLERMLGGADTPHAIRAWARGEHAPGRAVWGRLADAGVTGLAVPEAYEGVGPLPVELSVAYIAAGRHAVPGPLAETAATAVLLTALAEGGTARTVQVAEEWLPRIADGRALVTLAAADGGPYALDADAADAVFAVAGEELWLAPGHGPVQPSFDPARRLARPLPGGQLLARGPAVSAAAARAADWAAFATAALSLGTGLALLERTAAYARQRTQFGRPIGSFQAVKHRLADALIALEFARPLLYGAAVALASGPACGTLASGPGDDAHRPGHRGDPLACGPVGDTHPSGSGDDAHTPGPAGSPPTAAGPAGDAHAYGPTSSPHASGPMPGAHVYGPRGGADASGATGDALASGPAGSPPTAAGPAGGTHAYGPTSGAHGYGPAGDVRAAVAAAKVAAGEAAYTAARAALHLHGALGYTDEYDLSLWIRKARALRSAWGSPAVCRARVLAP